MSDEVKVGDRFELVHPWGGSEDDDWKAGDRVSVVGYRSFSQTWLIEKNGKRLPDGYSMGSAYWRRLPREAPTVDERCPFHYASDPNRARCVLPADHYDRNEMCKWGPQPPERHSVPATRCKSCHGIICVCGAQDWETTTIEVEKPELYSLASEMSQDALEGLRKGMQRLYENIDGPKPQPTPAPRLCNAEQCDFHHDRNDPECVRAKHRRKPRALPFKRHPECPAPHTAVLCVNCETLIAFDTQMSDAAKRGRYPAVVSPSAKPTRPEPHSPSTSGLGGVVGPVLSRLR